MAEETKTEPKVEPTPDLGKLVEAAVAKHGDQTGALKAFAADLYAARDDLKAVRAKLPPDGALVLTGDDAKDYGAYRNIGKPSDLRKVVDEHATLATENAGLKRDQELRGVAEKAGVKHAVLKTLAGALAFGETEIETTKDGKKLKSTVVTVKDGEAAPVPFDEYAAKHWGDFLPALKPVAQTTTTNPRQPQTPSRTDNTRTPLGLAPQEGGPPSIKERHMAAVRGAI
jgi:hypothetical protein